jgi:cobalt/nickel transport protein
MPRAGWWGFAALVEEDKPGKGPDGKPATTELGGLIWVQAVDMK